MNRVRVIIFAGSPADKAHFETIQKALEVFGIPCLARIASAHKTPKRLLDMIKSYDSEGIPTVYITVAGRSNALSGLVDAATQYPVLACPPPSEQWSAYDIWSSLHMPSGIASALILDPVNAALCAAKLLALKDEALRENIRRFQQQQIDRLIEEDRLIEKNETMEKKPMQEKPRP